MNDAIFRFIGEIVAIAGGAAAVAYAVFIYLGKRWVDQRFSERLESLRNEQARDLERLRADINKIFSRVTKIHQKEFDVLPIVWEKLQYAVGAVHNVVKPFKQYPDLRRMSQAAFDDFLKHEDLPEYKKNELAATSDKQQYYIDAVYERELIKAHNKVRDFHNYLIFNKIFLSQKLYENFGKIDSLLSDVLLKYDLSHETKDHKGMLESSKEIRDNLDALITVIENLVQERLHFESA